MSKQQDLPRLQQWLIFLNILLLDVIFFKASFNGIQYGKIGGKLCVVEGVVESAIFFFLCWALSHLNERDPRKAILSLPVFPYVASAIVSGVFLMINGVNTLNGADPEDSIEYFSLAMTVFSAISLITSASLANSLPKTKRLLEEDTDSETNSSVDREEGETEGQLQGEQGKPEAEPLLVDEKV